MVEVDLFVLGFIFEKPMYGYEISQKIEERRFRVIQGVKKASIYKSLKRLQEMNFINGEMISQKNHPPKKVFTISEKGSIEFKRKIKKALLEYSGHPMGFWALLWILDNAVSRSTFKKSLINRKKRNNLQIELFLEKHAESIKNSNNGSKKIPFYGFRFMEMVQKMIDNESQTIQNILDDLEKGLGENNFISEEEENKQ